MLLSKILNFFLFIIISSLFFLLYQDYNSKLTLNINSIHNKIEKDLYIDIEKTIAKAKEDILTHLKDNKKEFNIQNSNFEQNLKLILMMKF